MSRSPSQQESRLLAAWRSASRETRRAGRAWYPAARQAAGDIARRRGISFKRSVYLIAVLSNNKDWDVNLDLADDVVTQWKHGDELRGHYRPLLAKAERILAGDFAALQGSKVVPFARAIYGDDSAAVVDRWMFRIVGELPRGGNSRDASVRRVSTALRNVARRVRRSVVEVQATIWIVSTQRGRFPDTRFKPEGLTHVFR